MTSHCKKRAISALFLGMSGALAFADEPQVWVAPAPLSPQASRDAIVVPEGFTVELVAAEPLVMDPVSFAWGPDGRLWVVEMADYNWLPINDKSPDKPRGRVVYLTDTDGDGKYDKRTVFLDDLHYPTSVLPWHDGILITAAPDILYAEDTTPKDANPKADKREILYTGFGEGNPQLRVNGLQWGLDNWIYCANGWSHGVIKSTKTGKTLDIRGRDLRIRPDTGEIEPASGVSQFGRVRDDYGNWFGVDNSRLIIHYVFEDHHLRRNPHVAAPEPFIDLVTPKNPPCFPLGKKVDRLHAPYMANRFTSACGIAVYRDSLIKEFKDNVFICEPVHNLVTRRVLTPDGVTFKADRVKGEEQREFLASTDEWFRPVHARTGPDGALWIADMYRAVIEHPQWLPKEFNKKVDWMQGSEKGRIYRVFRKDGVIRPVAEIALDNLDDLVQAFASDNGTRRDMAHMASLWINKDKQAELATRLDALARVPSTPIRSRIQAIHALDGSGHIQPALLGQAVGSSDDQLARAALRISGATSSGKLTLPLLIATTTHTPRGVAHDFDLALALLDCSDSKADRTLVSIADRSSSNRQVEAAIIAAAPLHLSVLVEGMVTSRKWPSSLEDAIFTTAFSSNNQQVMARLLEYVSTPHTGQFTSSNYRMMVAIVAALRARDLSLAKLRKSAGVDLQEAIDDADYLFRVVKVHVRANNIFDDAIYPAMMLVGQGLNEEAPAAEQLVRIIEDHSTDRIQMAAAMALTINGGANWLSSFTKWDALHPRTKEYLLQAAMRRDSLVLDLLDHVEHRRIRANELSAAIRQQLLRHNTPPIRDRAVALLGRMESNRSALLESHRDVLTTPGDITRGQTHFEKTCAACHKIAGSGKGFGPDLGALSDRSPQAMLTAILDPNQAVDPRYLNYLIETKEGETHTGILLSETGNAIILGGADGQRRSILRTDIESMRSGGLSLMPEGLEQSLGKQGIADVIAFIMQRSQPARVLPGVKTELIRPANDGSLLLTAATCEAFGKAIDYEKEDNNLGQWTNADDFAAWSLVTAAAKYEVWLDSASDKTWLNNEALFTFENEASELVSLRFKIAATGTFNDYQQTKVGTIELTAGRQRAMLRAADKITGKLIELRSIRLVPVK